MGHERKSVILKIETMNIMSLFKPKEEKKKEKKKYISYNQRIIDHLAARGFKRKNMNFFVRKINEDITQSIIFGHSTQGRAHAKYYDVRVCIELPKVLKTAKELDIPISRVALFSSNIGELMNPSSYLEWLVTEDSSESYDNGVVDSILEHIDRYAIPLLDKFCTVSSIVEGIKKRGLPGRYGDNMHACIALLLYGEKKDFFWFVEQRSYEMQFSIYDQEVHWDYRNPGVPLNKICKSFLDMVDKLEPLWNT